MELMISILPLAVLILIVLSAMLAASETALFAMARLEHTREQMSLSVQRALDRLMRRPLESLIVIIGLNEACNIVADCLATIILLAWLGDKWGPIVAAPAMLAIVLLFCDITPKTFALGFPSALAWITARPLAVLADLVHPFARLFTPLEQAPRPDPVSEAEFKTLLTRRATESSRSTSRCRWRSWWRKSRTRVSRGCRSIAAARTTSSGFCTPRIS